jgi:hypothetical protein
MMVRTNDAYHVVVVLIFLVAGGKEVGTFVYELYREEIGD